MTLYDSSGTTELTGAGSPIPYETQTGDNGSIQFLLLADTSDGCGYAGTLSVTSGTLFSALQVTANGN